MHIDIGATDQEDAEKLVSVGDPAVLAAEPLNLPNGRLASRSLDNRLGSYVALEVARRISEGEAVEVGVVGAAVSQEEIGLFGSATTSFSLPPRSGSPSTSPTRPTPPASASRRTATTPSAPAR